MEPRYKNITVVGLGYIGLPTAAVLANSGLKVVGVDIKRSAVETINQGKIHIIEPDLDQLVHQVVKRGALRASLSPEPADAFIIAVPTPFKGDHEPDMGSVEKAAQSISAVLKKGDLVILESTSPVGATEKLVEWLALSRPDLTFPKRGGGSADIYVAYCPERVLPGKVLIELVSNDRVIGGISRNCAEQAVALYKCFVKARCIVTDSRTAEMCKLTENSFRDVNIAFANELSMICDKVGINVWELIDLANHHPRVRVLQPGPGVGGHCIAVDPWFIVSQNPQLARLIRTAREVNDAKPHWAVGKVADAIDEILAEEAGLRPEDLLVSFFGLTFKADIDDIRESPAIDIIRHFAMHHSAKISIVEPNVATIDPMLFPRAVQFDSAQAALKSADLVVILVDHKSFKELNFSLRKRQQIVDTRGILPRVPNEVF